MSYLYIVTLNIAEIILEIVAFPYDLNILEILWYTWIWISGWLLIKGNIQYKRVTRRALQKKDTTMQYIIDHMIIKVYNMIIKYYMSRG